MAMVSAFPANVSASKASQEKNAKYKNAQTTAQETVYALTDSVNVKKASTVTTALKKNANLIAPATEYAIVYQVHVNAIKNLMANFAKGNYAKITAQVTEHAIADYAFVIPDIQIAHALQKFVPIIAMDKDTAI
jgi:hypothetical protein